MQRAVDCSKTDVAAGSSPRIAEFRLASEHGRGKVIDPAPRVRDLHGQVNP
jgi:hypothetical protein